MKFKYLLIVAVITTSVILLVDNNNEKATQSPLTSQHEEGNSPFVKETINEPKTAETMANINTEQSSKIAKKDTSKKVSSSKQDPNVDNHSDTLADNETDDETPKANTTAPRETNVVINQPVTKSDPQRGLKALNYEDHAWTRKTHSIEIIPQEELQRKRLALANGQRLVTPIPRSAMNAKQSPSK